ncbi:hypothetical protein KQI84_16775 [bacterium]|nr:hypothetical protein [bacterium]
MKKARPISPGRAVLVLLALAAVGTAVFLPPDPAWIVLATAGFGAACLFLFAADALLGWWLKNSVGRAVNLLTFLAERSGALLLSAAALTAAYMGLVWAKLPESDLRATVLARGAISVGVFVLTAVIRTMAAADNEFIRLRRRLPLISVRRQVAEALTFERTVAPRLLGAFIKTGLAAALALAIVVGIAGGLVFLGNLMTENPDWSTWERIPFVAKIGIIGGFGTTVLIVAALILTWMRFVAVGRVRGRMPSGDVWHHADKALGTIGIIPTFMTSIWLFLFTLLAGFSGYYFADALQTQQGLAQLPAFLLGGGGALALLWLLVFFPTQWVLPMMTKHDCGWMRAIEASTRLVGIERTRAFTIGAVAALLALTIVGIPAAMALLIGALDDLDPLISLLLRERTLREANYMAEEAEELSEMPPTVKKGFEHLREGRYLDAVNTFQMYLRAHPDTLVAVRGEALGMLYLGNRMMARDRLDRWLRMDPENEEAKKLYREWEEGLWQEGGERFESAKARSVQNIGHGLSPRDLLGKEDPPQA